MMTMLWNRVRRWCAPSIYVSAAWLEDYARRERRAPFEAVCWRWPVPLISFIGNWQAPRRLGEPADLRAVFARLVGALLLIAVATPASAQTGALATYTLKVYNQGATAPFQQTTAPASATTCNLTPSPTPSATQPIVNPTSVEWNDPVNAGKACRLDLAAFFGGLPVNVTDVATLSVTDDRGLTSAESNVTNPFVRALPPGALASVRVVGGR